MIESLRYLIATYLGSGSFPVAPGTVGSLAACATFAIARHYGFGTPWIVVAAIVVASVLCVVLGPWYPRRFGRHDPSAVVIDECAGQWLALLPVSLFAGGWWAIGVGFVAFRFFDIAKRFGVQHGERLPGGWGVLVDDLIAGLYAALVVVLTIWIERQLA